jgi:GTP cyclohydrolase I
MSDQRMHEITYAELDQLLNKTAKRIFDFVQRHPGFAVDLYGVPRGGVPVALALQGRLARLGVVATLAEEAGKATVVVDDLVDSGATRNRYKSHVFYALIDKQQDALYRNAWVIFPWEVNNVGSIEDNIVRLIQFIGDDPTRGGLHETPARVAKAWLEWCSGYGTDPADVLKTFEDGAEGVDEMVVVKELPFYTHCEHHMAPFFGTATIAYVPDGKVVGLSKLDRLLDIFARRLQVQERLTGQVADALMEHLQPKGTGVVIKARHMCMESRGVRKQGHHTVTSALRGVFKEQASTRAEFLALAHG